MNADLESFVPLTYSRRGVQRLATTSAVAHDTTFFGGAESCVLLEEPA